MKMNLKVLEWFGVITAIAYSLFVASNVGLEFLGFVLLFISAISIGAWAYLGGHRGIMLLQFFYAVAGSLAWCVGSDGRCLVKVRRIHRFS